MERLQRAGLDFDGEDLADAVWLAQQIDAIDAKTDRVPEAIAPNRPDVWPELPLEGAPELTPEPEPSPPPAIAPIAPEPSASAVLPPTAPTAPHQPEPQSLPDRADGLPFKAPAAPALRQVRQLEKALRPLMRKVPSTTRFELDETATVEQVADRDWWLPVVRPALERWLDVALVVEESPAIALWDRVIDDWQGLLGRVGAFRDVRVWSLRGTETGSITLAPRTHNPSGQGRSANPRQLLDPSGRRLILLMSDCTSGLWRDESLALRSVLETWGAAGPLALVQLLPERLWRRTALVVAHGVQLSATLPGIASDRLEISGLPEWDEVETAGSLRLPVVTLAPEPLARWARLVAGAGDSLSAGVLFEAGIVWRPRVVDSTDAPDAETIARQFWAVASPLASQLAGYLAAVPVSLPVLHLIQAALLPESNQVHAAEVFLGGLMERRGTDGDGVPIYDFREGVRSWLVGSMPRSSTEKVLNAVSDQIAKRWGLSSRGFRALLLNPHGPLPEDATDELRAFARIAQSTLRRMGGEFAALGDRLEPETVGSVALEIGSIGPPPDNKRLESLETTQQESQKELINFPPLTEITFEEGYLAVEGEFEPPLIESLNLEWFVFEAAITTLDRTVSPPQLHIERFSQEAQQLVELLPHGVTLEMVLIPGGTFLMGAPEEEPDSSDNERPQHWVTVPEFLMGKYPITQAQWRAIAALPRVNIELNPNPSRFTEDAEGDLADNRPVEQISWYEASEACDRLAQATSRLYGLPSEAQWEYACRAGTTTAFYFGETLSPDLANYDGNFTYADGPKGIYRERTTSVGVFYANAWGLYDMHGNVWEWCADTWHSNYENAPTDGSAWITMSTKDKRLLRSGSWYYYPKFCRSAARSYDVPSDQNLTFGLRLCCSIASTSQAPLLDKSTEE
ncbi:MAG: formylglycine-generating enzyme family protein [Cyanobacteria bacterium]|nr:formylglycine-generating enzyme family protein [Cyanobacteriota bacterium]